MKRFKITSWFKWADGTFTQEYRAEDQKEARKQFFKDWSRYKIRVIEVWQQRRDCVRWKEVYYNQREISRRRQQGDMTA